MKTISWNSFKTKFEGKEETSFERLAYFLFCRELNLPKTGLFGYRNQMGIEREPILVDEEWCGFQSKFFEKSISATKINDSIRKAKEKNPDLDKVYVYINLEFSEGKQTKKPKSQATIENYATSLGLRIEWRVPSNIEAQLSLDDRNNDLTEYFFSLGKGAVEFLSELEDHSSAILNPIRTEIRFRGQGIKIDRTKIVSSLRTTLTNFPIVILSGDGGVGKTAVVKDFSDSLHDDIPCFVFKATEFNVPNLNSVFSSYGSFTSSDFFSKFAAPEEKYLVIDSAERLADLEYDDAFQEFLSMAIHHQWRLLFTTRLGYLDDLIFQFIEVYRSGFELVNIERLSKSDLNNLADSNSFTLPTDERFIDLLANPFYLSEYLSIFEKEANTQLVDFKHLLWKKHIQKSSRRRHGQHTAREECFLTLAKTRAESGNFFVSSAGFDAISIESLIGDEIIGRDEATGGYFITHDIYEEWALERIIERAFRNAESTKDFFRLLGNSLAIRRSFRSWLSDKLLYELIGIQSILEEAFTNNQLEDFWKDEILVSVLLSDYSSVFFDTFERALLANDAELLVRVIFWLRIACKEVDEQMLELFGIRLSADLTTKTLFTKPKGKGWCSAIEFLFKNRSSLGIAKLYVILPLLSEWNSNHKRGNTTRTASQLALFFYEVIHEAEQEYSFRKVKDQLIKTILDGSSEIKDQLKTIFNAVASEGNTSHQAKYTDLAVYSLSSLTKSFAVASATPIEVLKLADLFWYQSIRSDSYRPDVPKCFGISHHGDFGYFPASALQTPILQILRVSPNEAIDFVLSFTNKSVECYAKSTLDPEQIREIEVRINSEKSTTQYLSARLWHMYRELHVNPHVLESLHMALEKWLIEDCSKGTTLNERCLHLLSNSKSASITAVVTSVVLAFPDRLFDIAMILFGTKEFIEFDTARRLGDSRLKQNLMMFETSFPSDIETKIHRQERLKTCDEEHRKFALEHLALKYQVINSGADFGERQKKLWDLWDSYYRLLPPVPNQTEDEKTWRIFLARMDSRKMTAEAETEEGTSRQLIKLVPEIAPELKELGDAARSNLEATMKYTSLNLWATSRFRKEETAYKKHEDYENNPLHALNETKELIETLRADSGTDDSTFRLNLNRPTPSYVCAVLLRDFWDQLLVNDREYCREILMEFACQPLVTDHYFFQHFDGVEPAVSSLALLLMKFTENKDVTKQHLFLLLLNSDSNVSKCVRDGVLMNLWNSNYEDAQSIFWGYLGLKPKYSALFYSLREKKYKEHEFSGDVSTHELLEGFLTVNETEIEKVISNRFLASDTGPIDDISIRTLYRAFSLLPLGTRDVTHKDFAKKFFELVCNEERLKQEDESSGFELKIDLFQRLAYFVLRAEREDISEYLRPFLESFENTKLMADLFSAFVYAEDALDEYENFWTVWQLFYPKVEETVRTSGHNHLTVSMVKHYLFAGTPWKPNAKSWHTLKAREKQFFKKVAYDMGQYPSVLYSLTKLLNDIGSDFTHEGIFWLSDILATHKNELCENELETNTVFYLENLVRRYILSNRRHVRRTQQIKNRTLGILDFLINKGSATGYILRENIL